MAAPILDVSYARWLVISVLLVGMLFLFFSDDRSAFRPTRSDGTTLHNISSSVSESSLSVLRLTPDSTQRQATLEEAPEVWMPNSKESRVKRACQRFFVRQNLTNACPLGHMLYAQRSVRDGLGHQIAEIMFGLEAAQRLARTFVWEPFLSASKTYHLEQYDEFSSILGLNGLFDALAVPRWEQVRQGAGVEWREIKYTVGEDAARYGAHGDGSARNCSVGYLVKGYHHCTREGYPAVVNNRRAFVPLNCFQARTSALLQEKYKTCFRTAAKEMGTLFEISQKGGHKNERSPRLAPFLESLRTEDAVTVVWHIRVGDLIPHRPNDPHFARVARAIRNMTLYADPAPQVNFFLIGGGSAAYVLTEGHSSRKKQRVNVNDPHYTIDMFEEGVRLAAQEAWGSNSTSLFSVRSLSQLPIVESFLALANADVVVGSGSALVHAAALFSDRALFFSHIKATVGGDPLGVFLMADSIDLEASGRVVDSERRLRAALYGLKQRKAHDAF